jgi:hypothetical protein
VKQNRGSPSAASALILDPSNAVIARFKLASIEVFDESVITPPRGARFVR